MCGLIAAFTRGVEIEGPVRVATERMIRRGPDGEGFWHEDGACLGHRRLAIIDLDTRAAQPMHSACGRYVIVFNGEIYNFFQLREELLGRGVVFRTTSDTEVILALFAAEGAAMLPKLHGMFAFVIWDRESRRAFGARDPYGIKPLYYAMTTSGVILGSQVKALLATGQVSREPDPRGQAGFWMLGSVPEPHTWYRDIKAIPAGHFAWIEGGRIAEPVCWADIGGVWREAPMDRLPEAEVRERVRQALRETVSRHMVADVPVGLFLSGGLDSGVLAGLMVEAGARRVESVTIAYEEFGGSDRDEAPDAAVIAGHYGIGHHVRRVDRAEFQRDLPRIMDAMDQPSIDGINTWYASKAAAEQGLKVVMSGVGGDELFQGYRTFKYLPRIVDGWRSLARIPGVHPIGRLAAQLQSRRSGNERWKHAPEWVESMSGAWWLDRSLNAPGALPDLMGPELAAEALREFEAASWVKRMTGRVPLDPRLALGQIESTTYLRNQLLRDSDWASMDHSVELRTPLVDMTLLSSMQPLLPSFELHPGKRLLAGAVQNPLPRRILKRRKTGFGIPLGKWLAAESHGPEPVFESRAWALRLVGAFEGEFA